MLVAEMERLYNHIGDIGNLCAGVGFAVGISMGSRLKETLMRLNERITGNRFLRGMVKLGGVDLDLSGDMAQEIWSTLKNVENEFKELLQILIVNEAFLDRVNHTGVLPRHAALDLGVVGVTARASGINTDTRADQKYLAYNEMNFKVPVYTSGDVAARLWVRVDEVLQTMNILRQVLAKLPTQKGRLAVDDFNIKPYSTGLGWSESARGSNIHWVMIGSDNKIYRYFVRSASYPNWPALTVATPGNIIPDFPLINKSFELCYACIDH
jgi:Ni,Fe-hydrogenase III large subunit